MTRCPRCGRLVILAITTAGQPLVLDPEPVSGGPWMMTGRVVSTLGTPRVEVTIFDPGRGDRYDRHRTRCSLTQEVAA